MKAFISIVFLVASVAHDSRAAPANATDTNTRGFFSAHPPLGGHNNGILGGVNQGIGGLNSGFGGGNQGFGGLNSVNSGFGGFNTAAGGVNPGYGGLNSALNNINSGFGAVSPVVGGGMVPASGSVCQFWCNRGGQYVCCENSQQAHPGRCPIPRPQCPPVRAGFQGPQPCSLDIDCPYQNKCCYDTCLTERVCKPALYY